MRQDDYRKTHRYHKPHDLEHSFQLSLVDVNQQATIVPLIMQDEAMVPASGYNSNPANASFAESSEPNTYPESRIDSINCSILMDLTKHSWVTDRLRALNVTFGLIAVSFLEDLTPIDVKTGTDIETLLCLAHETTDKQCYPDWSGTDLQGDTVEVGANVPGLTTNTNIEGINISGFGTFHDYINTVFDAMKYYSNGPKLRKCLKLFTKRLDVSKHGGSNQLIDAGTGALNFHIRIPSKVKFQNEYTFFGLMIGLQELGSGSQYGISSDASAGDHVHFSMRTRYMEKNDYFDHEP